MLISDIPVRLLTFRFVVWDGDGHVVEILEKQHSSFPNLLRTVKRSLNKRFNSLDGPLTLAAFQWDGATFDKQVFNKKWQPKD